jgi:hypothetical protein
VLLRDDTKKKTETGEPGGAVLYRARLHWVMVLGPMLLMLVAGLSVPAKGTNALILLAASTLWAVLCAINMQTSEIKLTDKGLMAKIGFPWRRSYNIPYEEIAGIDIYQPVLGKLIDFGKVTIFLHKKGKKSFRMIRAPYAFASNFSEYKEASAQRGKSIV